ncbi:M20 family metallopeptidase [Paenibacillus thermoaerophilus]|uniref:M20 family metallopeptidase n=1 Tax=Paenibacillus thermoaerophilus TaxID=1215385 RepID=A0ABW2V279_9BACL|nr:amidohydrolase [Paenibacillus thermoaerophilus]TMV19127.1 amidohydrolase [Paenibacillus thermoaerophilus]
MNEHGGVGVSTAGLEDHFADMVRWRRHLHRYPELSFQEKETAAWIAERLRGFGLNPRTGVGGHGITVDIAGTRGGESSGRIVALRADIDALPIQDRKSCEYASTVPGVMHACGHDGHTASLLGLAAWLSARRDMFAGTVRLLFQPAEEISPGGALPMIRDGALDSVSAIYGAHLWTPLETGTVGTRPGPVMAAADEFRLTVTGRGGHGGLPHETVDSVVIASQIVLSWQTIVSRYVDPLQAGVISVGSFQAGGAFNVIAETAQLIGTVRTFDEQVRERIERAMHRMSADLCAMHGARADFEYLKGYPPVVNDEGCARLALDVGRRLFGEKAVREMAPLMAGEDFAYYLKRTRGCFLFVGAGKPNTPTGYPHHHPMFDFDESAMLTAARWLGALALTELADRSE